MKKTLPTTRLFDVSLTNASREDILKYVDEVVQNSSPKEYFVTPNPEMIIRSQSDEQFRSVLNSATISLVDGIGLVLAAKILGKGSLTRFSGTDFVEEVCKRYVKGTVNIGFLGGRKRVAERAAECLMTKYPGLKVVFANEEWSEEGFQFDELKRGIKRNETLNNAEDKGKDSGKEKEGEQSVKDDFGKIAPNILISQYPNIDILFVAFGFPKQEFWIAEHLPTLPIKIAVGVGGAFDYLSGAVPRAPRLMQAGGLEWLYRLIRQPWRWKRQMALLTFIYMVVREKVRKQKPE